MAKVSWKSLFIVFVVPMSVVGCSSPQAVRDVAKLTQSQLALIKVQGEIQQNVGLAQQTVLNNQINNMELETKRASGYISIVSNDWGAGRPNDRRLAILHATRQKDPSLLIDPYVNLRDPGSEITETAIDLTGLDKAIASISKIERDETGNYSQLSKIVPEIIKEYHNIHKETINSGENSQ